MFIDRQMEIETSSVGAACFAYVDNICSSGVEKTILLGSYKHLVPNGTRGPLRGTKCSERC